VMNKIPFTDPSPDRNDHLGVPKIPKPVANRRSTFEWPPDCLWPFIDRESQGDT
jgi:hypothetical protein